MDNKKVIKICVIIAFIILVAVIVEITVKNIATGVNEFVENVKEEKKQEEIYNSEESKTERQIDEFIKIIYEAIESKDYDYIYESLDETYKEYKFANNKQNMIDYIKENYSNVKYNQMLKANEVAGLYQVIVRVNIGNDLSSNYFTVNVKAENEYNLMFGEYINIQKTNVVCMDKNISYNINYLYETTDNSTYVLDTSNISESNIEIDINNIVAVSPNGKSYPIKNVGKISLEPMGTKRIELSIKNQISVMEFIEIEGKANNEEFNVKLYLDNGII